MDKLATSSLRVKSTNMIDNVHDVTRKAWSTVEHVRLVSYMNDCVDFNMVGHVLQLNIKDIFPTCMVSHVSCFTL